MNSFFSTSLNSVILKLIDDPDELIYRSNVYIPDGNVPMPKSIEEVFEPTNEKLLEPDAEIPEPCRL